MLGNNNYSSSGCCCAAEHGIKAHGTTLKDMLEIRDKIKEFIHTLAN
jgi:hypothetical protein